MSDHMSDLANALSYSPESGEFTWKHSPSASAKAGATAGTVGKSGYRVIGLRRRYVKAHRLAFFITYGRVPVGVIDHINGNKLDNRIANLRECTQLENGQNSRRPKNNKSGYVGVTWHKRLQKWCASIRHNYRGIHLGYFVDKEYAYAAYLEAKKTYHTAAPRGCGLPESAKPYNPAARARRSTAMLNPADKRVEA